jgi:hypothetical protein
MTGSGERFTGRWSRLKQEARAPAPDEAPRTANLPTAEDAAPAAEDTPTIAAEDLPDIDSLDKDSDYTPFMQDGVPEELKKLALRALWRSDPVLANLDGLNDYDEDFKAALDAGAEIMRKIREAEEKLSEAAPEEEVSDDLDEDRIDTGDDEDSTVSDDDGTNDSPELG